MKVVVDTNVIAYYLLRTEPFWPECRRFWSSIREPVAPASWEAELTNVLWMAARTGVFEVRDALSRLDHAKALGVRSVAVSSLWHGALVRACGSGVAAYDALFVEAAIREGLPLATFDASIIKAFPGLASRPSKIMRKVAD